MDLQVCTAQVHRVANAYGSEIDMAQQSERSTPVQQAETMYAEMDGNMMLIREGWKETKFFRVIKSPDYLPGDTKTITILRLLSDPTRKYQRSLMTSLFF